MQESLFDRISRECAGKVHENEPLSRHTSIRIGGYAECWYAPEDENALRRSLEIAKELQQPVTVVGGGSNLLISNRGISGLTLHLAAPSFKDIRLGEADTVVAGAGLPVGLFLKFLVDHGFGECTFLLGIPAQVGGAVAMNAGSGQAWIGSYVVEVRTVNGDGTLSVISQTEAGFQYRKSSLGGKIITQVRFRFPRIDQDEVRAQLNRYSDHRRQTQDLKHPSVGCMFMNPADSKKSAGQLIEEAGLKGVCVGGARISEIHGNFVVNENQATYEDVVALLDLVEKTIYQKFQIRLNREIQVIL